MNILGLVASGRKLGNSEILAKEMLTSLAGEKRLLRLSELSLETCRACYACLPKGKSCIIDDDLSFFLEQIAWANAVVIASPCYFLGEHTSIKLIGDRLISVLNDGPQYQGKRCVAVITHGVTGWEGYAREAVANFARFLHLELVGTELIQAASPGEAVRPEVLASVRALAARLADPSVAADLASSTHRCAGCGSSLLQIDEAGKVRCVMCQTTGKITIDNGRLAIAFSVPEHIRFSPEGMAEHGSRLERIKMEYLEKRKELAAVRKNYNSQDDWWIHPPRIPFCK